jgi:hypothetical protein
VLLPAGRIFMTSEGVLILRTVSRSVRSKEVENITEDYLTLEEGGQVVVDRMCCLHLASGKRAEQLQVSGVCLGGVWLGCACTCIYLGSSVP